MGFSYRTVLGVFSHIPSSFPDHTKVKLERRQETHLTSVHVMMIQKAYLCMVLKKGHPTIRRLHKKLQSIKDKVTK